MLSNVGRKRRRPRAHLTSLGKFILAAVIFLAVDIFTEIRVDKLDPNVMEDCASRYFNESVPDIISDIADNAGELQSVEDNSATLNAAEIIKFKSYLEERISEKLNGTAVLWIPVGSLTQFKVLNGAGAKIPVRFNFSSSVSVTMDDNCESYGINQNVCSMRATVKAKMHPVRAGWDDEYIFESSYIIYRREYSSEMPAYYVGR